MQRNEIAYVFPSDDGVACVAVSCHGELFPQFRQDPSATFDERIASHSQIAERYRAARRDPAVYGTAPEDNYVRIPRGEGWTLVGDAGMHQDPWSGRGIDMAAVHAALLADELSPALAGDISMADALTRYHDARDEHGLDLWRKTVTAAEDLSRLVAGGDPD